MEQMRPAASWSARWDAGSAFFGKSPLPTTALSKVQVLHVPPIPHSYCFWPASRQLIAVWFQSDVKEGQAGCRQVLLHSVS